MDNYRAETEIAKAREAQIVYDSSKPYWDARREQIVHMLANVSLGNPELAKEALYNLRLQLHALDMVEQDVLTDIQTGQLADIEIGSNDDE